MYSRLNIVSICRTFPTPTDPSGGVFVLNRVAAMSEQARVRAIQPLPYFPGIRPLADWGREPSRLVRQLNITHAPMFYLPGVLKSWDAGWLRRSIDRLVTQFHAEQPIDLIDAHFGYPEGAACVEIGVRLAIPVFVTVRGFETEYVRLPRISAQMIGSLRLATGVIAVSHSLAKLMREVGVDAGKVRVIHNAIDERLFSFGDKWPSRARLAIDQACPLVVSVGHLIPRKRHHVLVDAFAGIARSRPDARLAIIGGQSFDPAYVQMLKRRVTESGLEDCVSLVGNIPPEQVVDWLRAADLFALGTAREGCCNAVLEALAVGTPVITTTVGDNAEFVREFRNGILVPVDDAVALSDAIARGFDARQWDRPAIAEDLRRRVGGWDSVAGRVLSFFEERLSQVCAESDARASLA